MEDSFDVLYPCGCPRCGSSNCKLRVCLNNRSIKIICFDCGQDNIALQHIRREERSVNVQNKWATKVKDRDNHKCVICGSTLRLHAHHLIPVDHDKKGVYMNLVQNGVTVCERCHLLIHHPDRGDYE